MARALPGGPGGGGTAGGRHRRRRTARTADDMSGGGLHGLSEHGMTMSEADVAGVAVDTRHWIGGRRVSSPDTFTDLSPIDEQPLAEVARGGETEVAAAVAAAAEAFGGWAATPPAGRAAILDAIADGIDRRAEELAQVETRDNGSLLRSHRRSVMPRVAQNFRFFAGWLGELGGGGLEFAGHREQVSWSPAGVTAVITPWN